MRISTQTEHVFAHCGEEEGLRLLAKAGYDAVDYSMFGMTADDHFLNTGDAIAHARELRKQAEACGLCFNQAHAPFPCWRNGDTAFNAKMPERIATAIRVAGTLGASCIVVHPIAYIQPGEAQKAFNLQFYRQLAPIARDYNIKIALENMWGMDNRRNYIVPNVCSFAEDLCDYYDELDAPDIFTVCLDLGHCGLVGEDADEAIRILGPDRLGALHIHDNNYKADTHTMPYDQSGRLNWDNITRALGEIDYRGDFTYEADTFLKRFDGETLPLAARFMVDIAHTLVRKIDAARPQRR